MVRLPSSETQAPRRFGLDYVFPLMKSYQDPKLARTLAKTGVRWVNFAMVSWSEIEPRVPVHGKHVYHWEALDRAVRVWQAEGFELVFSLRLKSGWFAGPIKVKPPVGGLLAWGLSRSSDRLPAANHIASYQDWIRALVERYDRDGMDDMPGLLSSVRFYQVGNEYANPTFWSGTSEDYSRLLRSTRKAAQEASPEVKIISNGIRWNDLFHRDPRALQFEKRYQQFLKELPNKGWRKAWQRARRFTEATIAMAGSFDVLDAGGNGPYYSSSQGYFRWVKRHLEQTRFPAPIWDMEARCEPRLLDIPHTTFFSQQEVPGGKKLLQSLRYRWMAGHQEAQDWYRAEQARILAKVFVTRFAAGFEKVFMGMPLDWDESWAALGTPNPFLGLLSSRGRPWPAAATLGMLVQSLEGFARVTVLPASRDVALYRFDFTPPRPPVWVAWLRETSVRGLEDPLSVRKVDFRKHIGARRIRRISLTLDADSENPILPGWEVLTAKTALDPTPILLTR
jgi:hypothetical protein